MTTRKIQALTLCFALVLLMLIRAPLRAAPNADIAVTTTADVVDANGGACSGLTIAMLPGPDSVISLREAVCAANATAGADTITLGAGTYTLATPGTGEYAAATGDLNVKEDLTIAGAGSSSTIISGGNLDRVFQSGFGTPTANLSISGVTIRNGNAGSDFGGAIRFSNTGKTLALDDVILVYNAATIGGAIRLEEGSMTLNDSTVISNTATLGGGISAANATATLQNATLTGNTVTYACCANDGGGASFYASDVYMTNVTISGNSNPGRGGGADFYLSTAMLANVTITNNTANSDNSGGENGGGVFVESSSVTVKNSILAGNIDRDGSDPDCSGALTSGGYNLLGANGGCSGLVSNVNGDKVGTNSLPLNPVLGPLGDNGGATQTHALYTLSPAVEGGNPAGCTDAKGNALLTDQRGANRALDGNGDNTARCDGGAFEYDPAVCAGLKPIKVAQIPPGGWPYLHYRRVRLDWTEVNCADRYKIEIRQDSVTNPTQTWKATRFDSEFTKRYARGHRYFWRVQGCNPYGCTKTPWAYFDIAP